MVVGKWSGKNFNSIQNLLLIFPANAEFCKGLSVDIDAGAGFKKMEWTKRFFAYYFIWIREIITISEAENIL